jgi:pyroglutamyl-peptidase
MSPILLTAFEPFGGDRRNPSAEVLAAVVAGWRSRPLVTEVLPVAFATAGQRVEQLLAEHRPTAWVGLGLDGGATAICLERRAANLDDADLPDNAGDVRRGVPIDPAGPPFRPSTLPLDAIAAELSARGVPSRFSDSAGRFLCNHVFYRAAAAAAAAAVTTPAPLAGFVHLPWPTDWPRSTRSTPTHALTFADLVTAVDAVLTVVAAIAVRVG